MSQIRRNLFFSILERHAVFIINFGAMIVLSRLLTPAEIGLYSVASALINIAQVLREFGVFSYLVQEKDLSKEKIGSAAAISLTIGLLLTLLFAVSANSISNFYSNESVDDLIYILSANFLIVSYGAIAHGLMVRNSLFRANMLVAILSAVVNVGVSIVLATLGYGAECLAWASLACVSVCLVGNIIAVGKTALAWPNLRHWREILHYGAFASASGLLGTIGQRAPDLLIGRILSLEAVGLFSRGSGIVNTLRGLVTDAVTPVILSKFAQTHRENNSLQANFYDALSYISIVAWPAFAIVAALALPLIEFLFGDQWLPSAPVSQILCLGSAIGVVSTVSQTLLGSVGAVRRTLLVSTISVPTYVGCVALGATVSLSAAASAYVVSTSVTTLVSYFLLKPWVNPSPASLLRALGPSLLTALITAGVAWATISLMGDSLPGLFVASALAALTWLATVNLLDHPIRREIKQILDTVRNQIFPVKTSTSRAKIHLINPMVNWAGSELRTYQLYCTLKDHADVTVWSEFKPNKKLMGKININKISFWRGLFPKDGVIVFIGYYFYIGRWIFLSRAQRRILICNTERHPKDNFNWFFQRISWWRRPIEIAYASSAMRCQFNHPGIVLPSPIDINWFSFAPQEAREGTFRVGRLSRDVWDKHHEQAPEFYLRLVKAGCNVRIMGGTVLRERIADPLPPALELLPAESEEAVSFLQSLDCLYYRTSADWFEAFGRVVFEAMACGLPVVVHRHGGYAEFLTHGVDALIFDTDDEAFDWIMRLKSDTALRAKIGLNARRRVEEMYSDAHMDSIRKYYINGEISPDTQKV